MLKAHLRSLSFGHLYMSIVAVEIGKGVLHPLSYFSAYLAVSGLYPKHCQAVERLMNDPEHMARYLDNGIFDLHLAGVDFGACSNPRPACRRPLIFHTTVSPTPGACSDCGLLESLPWITP